MHCEYAIAEPLVELLDGAAPDPFDEPRLATPGLADPLEQAAVSSPIVASPPARSPARPPL
jgi:hypothetical protein